MMSLSATPSVSFSSSLDSVILHYPATNKKKRREYLIRLGAEMKQENDRARSGDGSDESEFLIFIHVHLYVNNRWYRLSVGKLDI
jgi:hypothetical protein